METRGTLGQMQWLSASLYANGNHPVLEDRLFYRHCDSNSCDIRSHFNVYNMSHICGLVCSIIFSVKIEGGV